jgi:hypothetical protein
MRNSPFAPQHEKYLLSLYDRRAEDFRKSRNVGRLVLSAIVIAPAIAAAAYHILS